MSASSPARSSLQLALPVTLVFAGGTAVPGRLRRLALSGAAIDEIDLGTLAGAGRLHLPQGAVLNGFVRPAAPRKALIRFAATHATDAAIAAFLQASLAAADGRTSPAGARRETRHALTPPLPVHGTGPDGAPFDGLLIDGSARGWRIATRAQFAIGDLVRLAGHKARIVRRTADGYGLMRDEESAQPAEEPSTRPAIT